MVDLLGGVLQTGANVFRFQVGEVAQDVSFAGPASEHFKHVLDTDTHSPDARSAAALFRIEGGPVRVIHDFKVDHDSPFVELELVRFPGSPRPKMTGSEESRRIAPNYNFVYLACQTDLTRRRTDKTSSSSNGARDDAGTAVTAIVFPKALKTSME